MKPGEAAETRARARTLLLQYGSNMSEERLAAKILQHRRYAPFGVDLDVRLLGCARLGGWRFVLDLYSARQSCLVGDIVEGQHGDEVWGALYELDRELLVRSDGRRSVLDRIEGHRTEVDPENYRPITVTVELDGEPREAYTYVGDDAARRRCSSDHPDAKPRPDYLRAILDGAEALGLPVTYVRALAATLEAQIRASD
jgi:gamma-glutamylcyclotransferase (GGCT)/AIG2-like uncharacterized protein YtfP